MITEKKKIIIEVDVTLEMSEAFDKSGWSLPNVLERSLDQTLDELGRFTTDYLSVTNYEVIVKEINA